MNNMNENEQNETSQPVFNQPLLRFIKLDLEHILDLIDTVDSQLQDKDLKLTLDIAKDHVEEVYDEIREREEKVDNLIRSIGS